MQGVSLKFSWQRQQFATAADWENSPRTKPRDEEIGGSSRAEFRMKVISEETWMNAVRSGFRNPKAAKPTPMLSTMIVPTKFCVILQRQRRAIERVSTSLRDHCQ
jgi:hypothetical protein